MASRSTLIASDSRKADALVRYFVDNEQRVHTFLKQVLSTLNDKELLPLIHSIRSRVKEPDHLRDKLVRKILKCRSERTPFNIDEGNLLTQITDLAGIRILHLHTPQIARINTRLKEILDEQNYSLVEGPIARTWDDEYKEFFEKLGIATQGSPTMYTSVHYVIASNSRATVTCEIQVRTLMEEVWGEVDHAINYPHPISSVACREQIRALARSTSSATRLVDSIFATFDDLKR